MSRKRLINTLNRLITKTPPSGVVVTYSYDLAGRLTGVGDTSSAITSAVPPGGAPSVAYTMAYTYDALNRPTATTYGDVAAASAPASTLSATFAHTYNAVNQRTGQTVTDASALGWIDYPAATPSATCYTSNNLNQYTTLLFPSSGTCPGGGGAIAPTYDGNGNLTSDGTYTIGYDAENRLTSTSKAGMSASYAYDGRGRRKLKTVNGATTITITDADNREVLEYDGGTGAVLRWYAYGLGSNDVVGQMNVPAGTRTTPVPDILGSVVASMDAGTGVLTAFAYRPYGASASPATPFAFTGQRLDAETGFYYYRARHYLPGMLGRFAQADPIGYDAGTNLYAYVGNDPLNGTDPTGLWSPGAHNAILGIAFSSRLPNAEILILQQASAAFDARTQEPHLSYMHSMRSPGMSETLAVQLRDDFINERIGTARELAISGDRASALKILAEALHPIMDASSPKHTDRNGQPMLWNPPRSYLHGHSPNDFLGGETIFQLTPAILTQQTKALNDAYNKVFK